MSYIKIGKYYGDSDDAPIYQFKEVLDVDYKDISDVKTWFLMEREANKEYSYCEDGAMNYVVNNGGFDSLPESHKDIVAEKIGNSIFKDWLNGVSGSFETKSYFSEELRTSILVHLQNN